MWLKLHKSTFERLTSARTGWHWTADDSVGALEAYWTAIFDAYASGRHTLNMGKVLANTFDTLLQHTALVKSTLHKLLSPVGQFGSGQQATPLEHS